MVLLFFINLSASVAKNIRHSLSLSHGTSFITFSKFNDFIVTSQTFRACVKTPQIINSG